MNIFKSDVARLDVVVVVAAAAPAAAAPAAAAEAEAVAAPEVCSCSFKDFDSCCSLVVAFNACLGVKAASVAGCCWAWSKVLIFD